MTTARLSQFIDSGARVLVAAWFCCVIVVARPEAAVSDAGNAVLTVSYPEVQDQYYRDFDAYFLEQMHLALEKSGVQYRVAPVSTPTLVESRSELYLAEDRYNIHWMNASPGREAQFIPVRIPLFKGLFGWRIFLIQKGQQARFTKNTSLEQLQGMVAGSGHDWPDTPIYRSNGLALEVSTQWRSLFLMLSAGRYDYFPRSVIEIWREVALFDQLDLEVEQNLALHYPAAYYFFVNKQNPQLADAVRAGLLASIKDGSFDAVFYRYFGDVIKRARLPERSIIKLENALNQFPSSSELWYLP